MDRSILGSLVFIRTIVSSFRNTESVSLIRLCLFYFGVYYIFTNECVCAFLQKFGNIEEDLNGFDVPVSEENILNNETKNGLKDLRDSGVDKINFGQFFNEVLTFVNNVDFIYV